MSNSCLKPDSARNVAVNSLVQFVLSRRRIADSLDEAFAQGQLDHRQRPAATELAYGTCRRLITIDHLIARQSKRGLRSVDNVVLAILQVAVYQLIYSGDSPDFAVVDEAVKQAKCVNKFAGSFVNAVLRNIQRSIVAPVTAESENKPQATIWLDDQQGVRFDSNIFPPVDRNAAKYLSLAYSMPPWLTERWLKQYGFDQTMRICVAHNIRPSLTLRVNRLRCTPAELLMRLTQMDLACHCHGDAVQLDVSTSPDQLPGYQRGEFAVQDITAMDVAGRLGVAPGMRVLDFCAAPGGKTTHLAELMRNQGEIIACDISDEKLALIDENCRRLGHTIVRTSLADNIDAEYAAGAFDAVLLDVPCSNTGVLGKRVEARHTLRPNIIKQLVQVQKQLLAHAATLIKPKGKILYSTCSIEANENERQVQDFLADHANFELEQQWLTLPTYRDPHLNHCTHDGGFTALLRQS
ncbi:MAG: methyltransferase domain-containing protein [Sedimentisphaerales bacterium]|nr:methyltransferase domain-containing protein [Sedimentisphaerales bacterium]